MNVPSPQPSDDLRSLVGQEVGGFRLTRVIGEGGMATVFRGENLLDSELVRAIKVVKPHLATRPEFVKRFAAEARVLDRLQHPNVVRFYGFRSERGLLFMELELLEGRSLAEAMPKAGRLDPQEAARAVLEASEGVAAAHALGVAHRDLKPDNIFITKARTAKVLDFGLALALDAADRMERNTVAGQVPGTPAYMPPEVCDGAEPDPSADVYALGMTFYEILLGHHPFRPPGDPAPSSLQLMRMQQECVLRPVSAMVPGLPPGLDAVIARATAKDPQQRFASARELADALRGVASTWASSVSTGGHTELALPTFRVGTPSNTANRGPTSSATLAPPRRKKSSGSVPLWLLGVGFAGVVGVFLLGAGVLAVQMIPAAEVGHEAPAPAPVDPAVALNPWVVVQPPTPARASSPILLGVSAVAAKSGAEGFRSKRGITPPSVAYQMQEHEVSWAEVRLWNEAHAGDAVQPPDWLASEGEQGGQIAAGGVPWHTALSYCNALGGTLPTEEQWEFAARGAELRPFPWGAQPLDSARTRVYQGEGAHPGRVKGSDQDRTPGASGAILYDMLGNVQEWTADLWRDNESGSDESWVTADGDSWRAVRGLPFAVEAERVQAEASAYRQPRRSSGPRSLTDEKTPMAQGIGFRCAKPVDETSR